MGTTRGSVDSALLLLLTNEGRNFLFQWLVLKIGMWNKWNQRSIHVIKVALVPTNITWQPKETYIGHGAKLTDLMMHCRQVCVYKLWLTTDGPWQLLIMMMILLLNFISVHRWNNALTFAYEFAEWEEVNRVQLWFDEGTCYNIECCHGNTSTRAFLEALNTRYIKTINMLKWIWAKVQ